MSKTALTIPVKTGDQKELRVETLNSSGDGIARIDGYTVFVPQGLPGDRVQAEIIKTTPRFGVGKVLERLESSPDRIEAPCPVFDECGGCQFQDLTYEKQLAFKAQVVLDDLKNIGKCEWTQPIEVIPADPQYHYRNKASFALQGRGKKLEVGFYKTGSHEVVDAYQCDTLIEPINQIKEWLRGVMARHNVSIYDESKHMGFLRSIVIRHSASTGQSLIGLITTRGVFKKKFLPELTGAPELKQFGVVGLLQNFNSNRTNVILGPKNRPLMGRDYMEDELDGLKFRISLGSFSQINPSQAIQLYSLVEEWVGKEPRKIVDAYCGNGGISLWLGRAGHQVLGIDEFAPAIDDARINAEWNVIPNCSFKAGTLENHLEALQTESVDTLIVDPPRKGLSTKVVEAIPKLNPKRMIYVSCNPSTLARDLALLPDYKIQDIRVIDMFPQTPHIETAVLLER